MRAPTISSTPGGIIGCTSTPPMRACAGFARVRLMVIERRAQFLAVERIPMRIDSRLGLVRQVGRLNLDDDRIAQSAAAAAAAADLDQAPRDDRNTVGA